MNTRRQFLLTAPLGVLAAAACREQAPGGTAAQPASTPVATPGAPPTFATAPASGPEVSAATFAEAEKLVQVTMSASEREQAAGSWRRSLAPLLERRTGPRKVSLDPDLAPATRWNPLFLGDAGPARDRFVRSPA